MEDESKSEQPSLWARAVINLNKPASEKHALWTLYASLPAVALMFFLAYFAEGMQKRHYAAISLFCLCLFLAVQLFAAKLRVLRETQNWIIEQIKQRPDEKQGELIPATEWPWGTHTTVALGHLDAAARRFWARYDPTDQSTAPTNRVVANWLVENRNVSPLQANAIASLLRADNLKAGPR